jgi:hypothetical protein
MAFGKPDPKEIIGMEPDELKSKLGKIDSLSTDLEGLKSGQQKVNDTLQSLLEKLTPKVDPKPKEDPPDFADDPDAAMTARLNPLLSQTMANTIALQHRAARESWPKDFDRWGTEIVQKMSELSADQQADGRVWKAMVLMVRGDHADQLERAGAEGKFGFLEPVSAGLRPDPSKSDNLTNAEREMVKTLSPFGVTAEKYRKGKERLASARSARLGRFAEVS